jgi:acyl-CoA synthetase (AMP-forming)/AMP-acid ligase II
MSAPDLLSLLHTAPASATALILPDEEISITYESFRQQIIRIAEVLAGAGVQRSDRIVIAMENGLCSIVSILAASIVGSAAPLNPVYRYAEFCYYMHDVSARVLLCTKAGSEEAQQAARDQGIQVFIVEVCGGIVRISGTSTRRTVSPPSPQDIALVLHTSGSTGQPKRVPLKHVNLATSCGNIVNTYNLSPQDVSLCVMPLFHVHGLVGSALSAFLTGGTVVVPARFNPLLFWRLVREWHVSWYSAAPTIHQLVLARAKTGFKRCDRLRFIRSCSAPLAPQLMEKIENVCHAPMLEAYGMTEGAHQICSNLLPPKSRRPGSVGEPAAVRVNVVNEQGQQLRAGEQGEIVIQGLNVIDAYEGNPQANTSSFFADGWFRTGDQGLLDDDGYLRITGRLKELIIRGGEKIAPREVDEVLLSHPGIVEAATFGVPHPAWGEEVAAAVVLREDHPESSLLKYCRDRLAEFKCPKKIYFTETIPKTASGKIQRLAMAAAFSNR